MESYELQVKRMRKEQEDRRRVIESMEIAQDWRYVNSANGLSGGRGRWSQASDDPANPHFWSIKIGFLGIVQIMGTCKDLAMVMSPHVASAFAKTTELDSYFTALSKDMKQLVWEGANARWGLPEFIYGIRIFVEDCTKLEDDKRLFVKNDDTVFVVFNTPMNVEPWKTGMIVGGVI